MPCYMTIHSPNDIQGLFSLICKFLLVSSAKGFVDSVEPSWHLHRKLIDILLCTCDCLQCIWIWWERNKRMKIVLRTIPSWRRNARPWTRLRAGNGESGISSKNGWNVVTAVFTFAMTLANVDSGCSASHSSICVKNLSSSSQFSSQGGWYLPIRSVIERLMKILKKLTFRSLYPNDLTRIQGRDDVCVA